MARPVSHCIDFVALSNIMRPWSYPLSTDEVYSSLLSLLFLQFLWKWAQIMSLHYWVSQLFEICWKMNNWPIPTKLSLLSAAESGRGSARAFSHIERAVSGNTLRVLLHCDTRGASDSCTNQFFIATCERDERARKLKRSRGIVIWIFTPFSAWGAAPVRYTLLQEGSEFFLELLYFSFHLS